MSSSFSIERRRSLATLLALGSVGSLGGCASAGGTGRGGGALAGLPAATAESVGLSPERLTRIDQVIGREIAEKRLPGAAIGVLRRGRLVHTYVGGQLDPTKPTPMSASAIFRAYSMTKPQVTVVAMQLMEEGALVLTDPVAKYLPPMKGLQVSVAERDAAGKLTFRLVPAARDMTVHDLMRHTSGLTYGDRSSNTLVREGYVTNGIELAPFHRPRQGFIEALARCPLVAHPATYFEYGVSTDVLGAVVEVITGQRLAAALEQRLWKPLGMTDTAFWVPPDKQARFAQAYAKDPTDSSAAELHGLIAMDKPPAFDSGGAGSVTTLPDYLRFLQMLLNGGTLDGARILSPASVRLMASDHMHPGITNPVAAGLAALGTPGYSFGLGFGVRTADGMAGLPGSVGEFMWAGTGGTYFWGDPKEQLGVVYMTQRPGASRSQYRRLIKQLTYQAIVA